MVRPGEDAAQRLVYFLNGDEASYLRNAEKNQRGRTHGRIQVLTDKGLQPFATWQEANQARWRILESAQRAIADVIRALNEGRDDEARRRMCQNFKQVPISWDVLKDPSGHSIITPAVGPETDLGYGISLLGWVTQAHLTSRIRECQRCNKWFFAKPAKKKFCTPECQEEYWAEYRRGEGRESEINRQKRWRDDRDSRKQEGS